MLTDDEKALFKDSLTFEETMHYAMENAKDIIALGFDLKKTFIYSDLKYISSHFLMNAWEFSKLVTFNQVRGAFGFNESTNVGRIFFPTVQCVAAFATSYPEIWTDEPQTERKKSIAEIQCLIPMGIDQDPYFRLLRENAHKMKFPSPKPALIHSKFLTALQGAGGKMSSSDPNSAIFMSDTPKQIKVHLPPFSHLLHVYTDIFRPKSTNTPSAAAKSASKTTGAWAETPTSTSHTSTSPTSRTTTPSSTRSTGATRAASYLPVSSRRWPSRSCRSMWPSSRSGGRRLRMRCWQST
jgi:hypothetical protein